MPIERNPRNLWKGAIQCIIKTIRHRKDRIINHFRPPQKILKYYEENFKMLHRKLKKTGKCEDEKLYNKIILLNNIENIYVWASHVQSVIEKEAKNPEKKPSSISKFKFWGKKNESKDVPEPPQEETYEKLFAEIESASLPEYSLLPKDYIRIKFELNLGSGVFKLLKSTSTSDDSLIFTYTSLYTSVSFKVQGLDANLSMQDLSLSSVSNKVFTEIIKKVSSKNALWVLNFRLKPRIDLAWSLESIFQSLEINYQPIVLALILSFFVVPSTQDSAKYVAWDTIKGIQDTTQEALNDLLYGESLYSIKINCSAPKIKIPSPTNQGYFLLNLGDISLTNSHASDHYEHFDIFMSSLGLEYQPKASERIFIVPEFEITSNLQFLKSKYKQNKKFNEPETIIESNLPIFKVILNAAVFHQLQRLPEMFKFEEKKEDTKSFHSSMQGTVKKLAGGVHAWKEYKAALVGCYLYFYSIEGFGGISNSFFYIKDCSLQDISLEIGIENCLKLHNLYGECIFSVKSSTEFEKWKYILGETINEFESRTSVAAKELKKESQSTLFKLNFQAPSTIIQLTNEKSELLSEITLSGVTNEIIVSQDEYALTATLGGMEISEAKISRYSKLVQSGDSQDLIKLSLKYIDSKSPNYKNQDFKLKIRCGVLKVNWNYHLIIYLLNFFQFAEYSDPTLIITKSVGTVAKDHILLNFSIKTDDINISLNNSKNQIALADISIQKFESRFTVQTEGSIWSGTLGNLEINDLTNYPATASNEEFQPFKLFTVRENNSLMHFNIIMYSDQFEDRDMDVSTKIEVDLNSINFVYLHQPVMRIIDYLNYHVLGAFDTENRVKQIDEFSVCKPKVVEEKLSFTSIFVKIHEPIVYIPPRPGFSQYFALNLGKITVKNRLVKANNPGWIDIYAISMKNLKILSTTEEIADEFDMELEIQRKLLKSKDANDPSIEKTYKISGECGVLKLNLSMRDYNLIIKTSDLNILYDDQLDAYISPTYKYEIPEPGKFLTVDFTIKIISVLFTMENVKIFELLCIDQFIDFIKFNDGSVNFNIKSKHILGLIDENSVRSKVEEFTTMAENVFSIAYDSLTEFFDYSDYYRLSYILFGPISNNHPEILNISIKISLDSSKDIFVSVSHLRINFHLSMFYQLLNYLSSGIPNYTAAKDTPQDYIMKYRPKAEMAITEIAKNYYAPKISATCSLSKSIVVLPSTRKSTTLVAHSDLLFTYIREKEGELSGPNLVKRLILEKFEIFHAKYEDLLNFVIVDSKRKVLEPIQFIYEYKEFKINNFASQNYIIGSLNCALSYRDLLLIQNSYGFQQEMLTKDSSIIKVLESFSNLQALENRMNNESGDFLLETQISKQSTSFSFAGLNIILINDALTAYTPIIDLSIMIGDKIVTMLEQEGEMNFKGTFTLRSSYYNPIADVWEPFIEGFNLESEIVSSKNANIKTQYVFSVSNEVLNINLSEVMIQNLQGILKIWDSNSAECQEVISPFQIKNQIGYSILIQYKYSQDVSVLDSGCTVDYIVDYYCREKKLGKSDSITVSIYPGDFQPPKLRIKTNKVQCCTYKSDNQVVIVDTRLEATRKTLTIRSPVVIENKTEYLVNLIFQKGPKIEQKECDPDKNCPVPYDFIRASMTIEIYGSRSRKIISLDELWVNNKDSSIEAHVGDMFICLHYKISKGNRNKRTLFLKPPLILKNCLPTAISLRIYEGKPSKFDEIGIKQDQEIKIYSYSLFSELASSISIENFSRSNVFPLLSHQHALPKIKVADRKSQELFINLVKFLEGSNFFVFYVTQVIINNSLNPVAFYQRKKGTERLIPGQNFTNTILPSNTTNKILIGLGNKKSKAFKIDSVGISDIIELLGDTTPAGYSAKYQYTLDVQLVKILKKEMMFTKVIVISPRYLVVNNTEAGIIIAQDGLFDYGVILEAGAQLPFHWTDKNHQELVIVKVKGDHWAWSGPFSIDSIGSFSVQSKDKREISAFLMMKIEIKIVATTAHVIFEKETLKTASYRIQNDSSIYSLAVYQKGHAEDTRFINAISSCLFTWSNHLSTHEVIVEFILGVSAIAGKDTKSMYVINLDKLNQSLKIKIKEGPKDFDALYVNVLNENVTRILKFTDMPIVNLSDASDIILSYYNISISKLGISLIEHVKHKSKEIIYLTATSLVVLAQKTKAKLMAELIIKDIQADNQISPDVIYPVMLHSVDLSTRNVLHVSMVINNISNNNCRNFESFEFLLQTLSLKLDTICVRKLIELTNRVWMNDESINDLFETLEEFKGPYIKSEVAGSLRAYYFSFLKINPIKIIIFFVPIKEENTKKDFLSGIAAFGMALTTLEAAPIKLYSIQLSDVFATEKRLKESFQSHYKSQLVNEFYSLIGHSNILGNPIGLLNDLGTGVVDFFYEPAQGMVNGPISAGEGIIKGTSSLIKNTVSGTFGTVSKLTSSITTGLAVLTQDKEYVLERQRDLAKNKPTNIVDGVGLGMLSLLKNVGQGITGIVTEPIKGFKKDNGGVGGMMKGGLRGLGGLVVKPIAGALDMVSRSAEGIKNTANIFSHSQVFTKERLPRLVYGASHSIQVYNANDALVMDFLYRIGKKKYYEKEFVELIQGGDQDGRSVILIFFTDRLIYLNVTREKIMWKALYRNVIAFELKENILWVKAKGKKNKEVISKIEFRSPNNNSLAEKKLIALLQANN